jgi:hypothetical protein
MILVLQPFLRLQLELQAQQRLLWLASRAAISRSSSSF